jgi:spore maturation protein SpmB
MTDAMKTYGPDSPIGYLVSLLNGSSETTFYVLALYFGSIQVKAIRHTLLACLASDAVGLVVTTVAWRAFYVT